MSAKFPDGVEGHVVSMMSAPPTGRSPWDSVAECECGWRSQMPCDQYKEQDAAVEAHWSDAVAKGATPR